MKEVILLEIKLPVQVREFSAVTDAICAIHGKEVFTRQVGPNLQLFKKHDPKVDQDGQSLSIVAIQSTPGVDHHTGVTTSS